MITTRASYVSIKEDIESKYQVLISELVQTKCKLAEFKAKNTKLANLQMDFVESFETEIEYVSEAMTQTINGMVWDNLVIAFFGETNAGKSTTIETLRILFDPQKQQSTEDGLIVGDGQSDFTKTYDEYHLKIFGKPFTLIDVPGIEGKEEDFKDDIKRALQQAHVVFYVQGHNKKPDSATAEKIKKYLNDWVNVYSIYNVRGGASNYDEDEERDNLFTSDVDKTYTLIEDTFKDILGDVYKGNIAIQALLAMCANAHFANTREDLIKTQKKLVSYFGTAEDVYKFSNFQEIVNLIKTKTEHFDEELIIANKQKLVALCSYIIKEIEELESRKTADMQKISNNLKQYRDAIKQVIQTTKQNLKVNTASENNRLFSSLQNNMCATVDKTDLDNLKQQLTYQAVAFRNEYNDTMQQLVSNEFLNMNQSLKDKQKQYLDCFKQIPDIEINPISIRGVELGNIISELEFNFGDLLKNLGELALHASGYLIPVAGPIIGTIGVLTYAGKKIFFDGGESAEKKHKQNAKNELRKQLNTNKQHALSQLYREIEICSNKIDYKIGELNHIINSDLEQIQSIKITLTQVSKQIREYSNNIQNM